MVINASLNISAAPTVNVGSDVRRVTENIQAPTTTPVADQAKPVPKVELDRLVAQVNDFAKKFNRELQFDVDDELGRTVIRVVDKESGELIRQIPTDDFLAIAKQLKKFSEELMAGKLQLDGKSSRDQMIGLLVKTQA